MEELKIEIGTFAQRKKSERSSMRSLSGSIKMQLKQHKTSWQEMLRGIGEIKRKEGLDQRAFRVAKSTTRCFDIQKDLATKSKLKREYNDYKNEYSVW